jgi:Fe-S cluster assembly scaffold protein SufB
MTTATPPNLHSHLNAFNFTPAARAFISMKRAMPPARCCRRRCAASAAAKALARRHRRRIHRPRPEQGLEARRSQGSIRAAAKQAREAREAFRRAADRLVKLPAADAKPEDLRAFYERLGAPKEAKDYDLSAVKDTTIADAAAQHRARARLCRRMPRPPSPQAVAKALESKATTRQHRQPRKSWPTRRPS